MANDQDIDEELWTMVWNDEFEGIDGALDESKWMGETGFLRNDELQYYTGIRQQNLRIEDGMLVLETRKEKYDNACYDPTAKDDWRKTRQTADYTSASITTRGKAAWKYGKIMVRAKIPGGRGMWPAIWMIGNQAPSLGWPACGEIDIMENVGFSPDEIFSTVHTKDYNHVLGTQKGKSIVVPEPFADFHLYAVEWNSEKIIFSVDGNEFFYFENDGKGRDSWPFDMEHYLIINIAVGGAWGGEKGVDDEVFPQQFLVDYVRVYQRV